MFTHILKRAWKNKWLKSKIFWNRAWNSFLVSVIVVNETLLGQTQSRIAQYKCNVEKKPFTRNLTRVLFTALKYKKALTAILKENLHFKQLWLNYINSQKKQTEKEHLRLVISSIRVAVVAKTDDEVYVSSTIKM